MASPLQTSDSPSSRAGNTRVASWLLHCRHWCFGPWPHFPPPAHWIPSPSLPPQQKSNHEHCSRGPWEREKGILTRGPASLEPSVGPQKAPEDVGLEWDGKAKNDLTRREWRTCLQGSLARLQLQSRGQRMAVWAEGTAERLAVVWGRRHRSGGESRDPSISVMDTLFLKVPCPLPFRPRG